MMVMMHLCIRTTRQRTHFIVHSRYNSSVPKTAIDLSITNEQEDALKYLDRPLGVKERPTTATKSWREKTTELMNQDVRTERRRHLIKESSKGYYSDFNALKKFGGKTWIAPPSLIRADHALYFPDVTGKNISESAMVHTTDLCSGHVSVIATLTTKMSEEHVESYVKRANEIYLQDPQYRFIQINLQENMMKAMLVSFYTASLRRAIKKELHPYYLLSSQNLEYVRESLGMVNKHIGYVYLVDKDLKVRWAGGGLATEEEAASLENCVRVLLDRNKSLTHKSKSSNTSN